MKKAKPKPPPLLSLMSDTFAKLLSEYANQRGGGPVVLTDPAVAAELGTLLAEAVPAPAFATAAPPPPADGAPATEPTEPPATEEK